MIKLKNKTMIWAGILFAQIILFYGFSKSETIIHWHQKFFEAQKYYHQLLFFGMSFSVGDIFYLLLLTLIIYFLAKIKTFKVKLLLLINLFYFLYQIFWGLLYFQTPLMDKLPQSEISQTEAEALTWKYLNLCKTTRELTTEDRNGIFFIKDFREIEQEILDQQNQIPHLFDVQKATHIHSIKPSLFSTAMNHTGILGYYNPFTAEAQYNPNLPHSQIPFTIAHETAHQLGIAREQEAHFWAYLIGSNSENTALKYSTYWFVLKNLIRFHSYENPDFAEEIFNQFSEKMKNDLQHEQLFYEKYLGLTAETLHTTNDLFLKANQQDGSISYTYFLHLFFLYEKASRSKIEQEAKNTNDEKIITPS